MISGGDSSAPSCVAMLEELHALGANRFVVFGNCGVLNQQIRDCGIIIPTAAMRDEGTSFHYAPPWIWSVRR